MDAGKFISSRKKFIVWAVVPLWIVLMVTIGGSSFVNTYRHALLEKKELIELMPIITAKIAIAERVINTFHITQNAEKSIESINAQISESAERNSVTLESIGIEKELKPQIKTTAAYRVILTAKGELNALSNFIANIQMSDYVVHIDGVEIGTKLSFIKRDYTAEIEFVYYEL